MLLSLADPRDSGLTSARPSLPSEGSQLGPVLRDPTWVLCAASQTHSWDDPEGLSPRPAPWSTPGPCGHRPPLLVPETSYGREREQAGRCQQPPPAHLPGLKGSLTDAPAHTHPLQW